MQSVYIVCLVFHLTSNDEGFGHLHHLVKRELSEIGIIGVLAILNSLRCFVMPLDEYLRCVGKHFFAININSLLLHIHDDSSF